MSRKAGRAGQRKFQRKQEKKSSREHVEIQELDRIIEDQAPPKGSNPLAFSSEDRETFASARKFEELPLSRYSKDALKESKFVILTAIQRAALPHALAGRDVLGAAKTGSGKTIAFLLPLLELLYRKKWTRLDGLGGLVISPTRELALQIFEELRKVGHYHELSAGLLIGGKEISEEAALVAGMNILVATPGRLLQHMDETPGFDASSLQMLVLDEADRILDMGFAVTLNAIITNLPKERQTLLFSATQTKNVASLARLSLHDPEYVSVHEDAEAPTPTRLEQAWMEVALEDKLDVLWSFLRTHLQFRVIVFLSTCKQVRFVYEGFRRLRPGTPLRALHGHMSQYKRMGVYKDFCSSKAGVLFATDIAARGLDFPSIDWVIQFDSPEDVASYIHRVGRTARYTASGKSLLFLLPSEKEGMLGALHDAKVPTRQLKQNPAKIQPVSPALQALLSKDTALKETAQRALVSYLRSVFLQPNKRVFDVTKLPIEKFALSMGLSTAPRLRFLKHASKNERQIAKDGEEIDDDVENEGTRARRYGRQWISEAEIAPSQRSSFQDDASKDSDTSLERELDTVDIRGKKVVSAEKDISRESDEEDFLKIKKRSFDEENQEKDGADDPLDQSLDDVARPKKKRLKIKPGRVTGRRVVFDDEGNATDPLSLLASNFEMNDDGSERSKVSRNGGLHTGMHSTVAERAAAARAEMARRDAEDKAAMKALRKAKRGERRAKRLAREFSEEVHVGVSLADVEAATSDETDGNVDGWRDSDAADSRSSDEEGRKVARGYDVHNDAHTVSPEFGAEVAHLGMSQKGAANAKESKRGPKISKKKRSNSSNALEMTLADQEALALQLLRQG